MGDPLTHFFEDYLAKGSLFADKRVLQAAFVPAAIPHRDAQISQIAKILAPCLRREKPSNLFVYGKTGSGKTLTVRHTTTNLGEVAAANHVQLKISYLNCKLKRVADTEYRLLAQLLRDFGRDIPPTGLPTDEVYAAFFEALDATPRTLLLILDEVDQLVKRAGDEIIYNLTRINAELRQSQIALVGISNDLTFLNHLDPRVKSSLSEEELVFPPYNALQLQDILATRAAAAFHEGVIEDGVLAKCAAYAAREHGDARRALELLRVAGELAERDGNIRVGLGHLDAAEEKVEHDRILDAVALQPKQFQLALYAILTVAGAKKGPLFTGEVYDVYRQLCGAVGLRPLTHRRVSDIIGEFDLLGLITTHVISKGRFGRTREIGVAIPSALTSRVLHILKEDLALA